MILESVHKQRVVINLPEEDIQKSADHPLGERRPGLYTSNMEEQHATYYQAVDPENWLDKTDVRG